MALPRAYRIFLALLIGFLASGPVAAQDIEAIRRTVEEKTAQYQKGAEAYSRGDYEQAVAHWEPLAEAGSSAAQNSLGYIYVNGLGVRQDYAKALDWYRRSATLGNAAGQHNLGSMYAQGLGLARDYEEALKWYRRSARQGYAEAGRSLGVAWYHGRGVPRDHVEAYKWFEIAAVLGHPTAAQGRDVIARKMSEADIAEARAMAREWLLDHKLQPGPGR